MAEETPARDANKSTQNRAEGKPAIKTPKKTSKQRAARRKSGKLNSTRKGRAPRPYPAKTLEEALVIPQAIREQNNGNPWDTEMVAQASLSMAKNNNKFFYTAGAARDYGLTVGTRDTEKIELAPLGREIFFAGDEEAKKTKMLEVFFSIDVFKRVFKHYGSAELPKKEFLANTLQKNLALLQNATMTSPVSSSQTASIWESKRDSVQHRSCRKKMTRSNTQAGSKSSDNRKGSSTAQPLLSCPSMRKVKDRVQGTSSMNCSTR